MLSKDSKSHAFNVQPPVVQLSVVPSSFQISSKFSPSYLPELSRHPSHIIVNSSYFLRVLIVSSRAFIIKFLLLIPIDFHHRFLLSISIAKSHRQFPSPISISNSHHFHLHISSPVPKVHLISLHLKRIELPLTQASHWIWSSIVTRTGICRTQTKLYEWSTAAS